MANKQKPETAELLPPQPEVADFKKLIAEAVEQKVSEIMSSADVDLEPWFRSKKVAHEIRRRQRVIEQRKWTYFFEDWGCLVCGTRDKPHVSNGMCSSCLNRTVSRLKSIIRQREKSQEDDDRGFDDSMRLAREALAGQSPALPGTIERPRKAKARLR